MRQQDFHSLTLNSKIAHWYITCSYAVMTFSGNINVLMNKQISKLNYLENMKSLCFQPY